MAETVIPPDVRELAQKIGEALFGRHQQGWIYWPLITEDGGPAETIVANFIMADRAARAPDLPGTPSPHKGEPVAYRYRAHGTKEWSYLQKGGDYQQQVLREQAGAFEFQPLYASPPPVVEGMVLVRRKLTPEMDTLLVRAGSLNTIYDTQNVWDKLLALAAPNQADGAGE